MDGPLGRGFDSPHLHIGVSFLIQFQRLTPIFLFYCSRKKYRAASFWKLILFTKRKLFREPINSFSLTFVSFLLIGIVSEYKEKCQSTNKSVRVWRIVSDYLNAEIWMNNTIKLFPYFWKITIQIKRFGTYFITTHQVVKVRFKGLICCSIK